MGFARCGVEGNLREIQENTRKKPFLFLFFVNLKKRKWFLLGKEFIESFELLSPAFAKPLPVSGNFTKPTENKTTEKTFDNLNELQKL